MSTALTAPQATNWESREMVETLKQTVAKGATDAQFKMFVEVCKQTGLNPFLKEIWYVPSVGVMAGRDGYLRVANEHPQFDGMETYVERDEKGIPLKAVCKVWRKDRGHPITCEAWYSEYRKNSNVWQTYPSAMISKVAEVLALKRSFSINGIVTEEEIGEQKLQAQDAQQDVAQRRIKELNSFVVNKIEPITESRMAELQAEGKAQAREDFKHLSPATIIELADSLEQPPEPPLAPEVKKPPKKAVSNMTETAKKRWLQAKLQLRAVRDDKDKFYYAAIAPYKHCTEIPTKEEAEAIWKVLQSGLVPNSSAADKALLLEVETHALRIGAMATHAALARRGLQSVEEVLTLTDSAEVDALLTELRTTA